MGAGVVGTAVVVLAAGGGSRFVGSGPKLLAPWRARPLVAWPIAAAVAAGLAEVVVVVGAVALPAELLDGVTVVVNERWREGQATSLWAGIEAVDGQGHDAAVVVLGDQPGVAASCIAAVASCAAPLAVATYGGQRRPPVRLDRSVWPMLPRTGDQGARRLMTDRADLVAEVACSGSDADIDTVEDLRRWS